jgi:hypothetical protein
LKDRFMGAPLSLREQKALWLIAVHSGLAGI